MAGRKDWGDDGDDDEVIPHEDAKVHRRIGPPGCGKTTHLTRQVELAIEKYGRGGVVVASLTRAAAAEVAGRGTKLPRQNIGTLHSHAYRALDKPVICETAEGIKRWNEFAPTASYKIDSRMAVDPENAAPEQQVFDTQGAELLNQANVLRQRMIPVEAWPARTQRFYRKWMEFKEQTGLMDFTDLIERAVEKVPELKGKPDVILLDEAQDMSKLEMTWAVNIGMQAKQFVIVGDPDQNLYQWRGSDPNAFYQAKAETQAVLSQSYRVPAAVHERAVAWIEQIKDRPQIEYKPRHESPGDLSSPVAIGSCTTAGHIYKDPASLIRSMQKDVDAGRTVMVLASCGYMLIPILAELRNQAIPFHNPYRVKRGDWNPMRAGRRLLAFKRPDPSVWGEDARMWNWEDLWAWVEHLQAKDTLTRGSKTMIQARTQERDRFGDEPAKEAVELAKLATIFKEDQIDPVMNMDIEWWANHLNHQAKKSQRYALEMARAHGAGLLREEPKIIVGTIHSVKGGEADKVYLMPDLSTNGYFYGYKRAGAGRDAVIRQFYVAMTRARHDLVLCAPSGGTAVKW